MAAVDELRDPSAGHRKDRGSFPRSRLVVLLGVAALFGCGEGPAPRSAAETPPASASWAASALAAAQAGDESALDRLFVKRSQTVGVFVPSSPDRRAVIGLLEGSSIVGQRQVLGGVVAESRIPGWGHFEWHMVTVDGTLRCDIDATEDQDARANQGSPMEEIHDVSRVRILHSPAYSSVATKIAEPKDGPFLIGLSTLCPKDLCIVNFFHEGNDEWFFSCPCCGTKYSPAGLRVSGPGVKPLLRQAIRRQLDGRIRVYLDRPVQSETARFARCPL
jgi:hypothetical protein